MANSNVNLENIPEIEKMRHTASHILAQAVLKYYPDAKLGIGPAIDDGFYYDFQFNEPITDEDLQQIEKEMKRIIDANLPLTQSFMKRKQAEKFFKEKEQRFKIELLRDIPDKELSFFTTGENQFVDMCRGPHVESTGKVGAVKLMSLAGAYWRGNEKQPMLTRIYGLAFKTPKELRKHITMLEEAEKRDHRVVGKNLGLFVFSDLVGKGLPLWTAKGATVRRELERFIVDEELKRGYQHVYTPDIAKIDLYKTSGHYPYYKDSMYAPIKIDEEEFMLRPMTCPHHFELYRSQKRSYRELPMRIAELAKLYRYEKSGELTGLMRVRSFCLADAHIVAMPSQAEEEINQALDLIEYASQVFGLKANEDYRYRLSLGDRNNSEKYYKDDAAWDFAENVLREVLKKRDVESYEAPGEAAFYGPKIDIQMKNTVGKEDTAFTVQYDFVMPKRFDLKYDDEKGEEKEPIVIHRSSIGAIERIMALLIEKYAGAFPLWLAPVQAKILPISDSHNKYAQEITQRLQETGFRVVLDNRNETLQYKIRDGEVNKVPYLAIVGDKEIGTQTVSVRSRGSKEIGLMKIDEFIQSLQKEIANKS
ncbi:MAG: Threonine-tRNA ligase [candidate division WS6 bacterium GW2011_GWF2_39_15]|uniref:Threonine--tRNA ligase n=1 Tax=candidate division WS6 bacterium GW2011_GWF2_39_15 TaxID=1619100 RepID=A0A0G0MSS1_9BACT|nr:MAG: Threonine-tRNA ligase [candidate division WS6 bacterium GW2011_GWF2_39_15]